MADPSPAEAACPDDNVIAAHAAGRLPASETGGVTAHLRECQPCRLAWQAAAEGVAVRSAAAEQHTPEDLLRQHIEEDAPARELRALLLMSVISSVGLVIVFGVSTARGLPMSAAGIPVTLAALYALAMGQAVRRGWYWRHLPLVNVIVESSTPVLAMVAIGVHRGPDIMVQSLFPYIWAGLLVFSAYRASPRLSVTVGAVAALEAFTLYALLPAPHDALTPAPWVRATVSAVLLFMCGLAGALVARHLLARAEQALRAAREQDLMGKYVLESRIGFGGMAEVFRATYCPEGGFRKAVAVKRVLPRFGEDARFAAAFLEEARLGALLSHPNVVQVLDCGRFRGSFILAMEWVDGMSLAQLLRAHGPLPLPAVLHLGAELCSALEYIHGRCDHDGQPLRLVHRDLNPPNVLVSRIGEVKLSDFGVASAAPRVAIGERNGFYGKEGYAPPEQVSGGGIDGRTDLFALGLTLRDALGGKPGPLQELIASLTQPHPDGRPPSARAVREALLAVQPDAYLAGREQLAERVKAPVTHSAPRQLTEATATSADQESAQAARS